MSKKLKGYLEKRMCLQKTCEGVNFPNLIRKTERSTSRNISGPFWVIVMQVHKISDGTLNGPSIGFILTMFSSILVVFCGGKILLLLFKMFKILPHT
jgi:hypothetical protein